MSRFVHDESITVLSGTPKGKTLHIGSYSEYEFKINYITNKGERKVKYYTVYAFGRAAAHRKVGDMFRKDYINLRLQ